jgi:hypothetical protein
LYLRQGICYKEALAQEAQTELILSLLEIAWSLRPRYSKHVFETGDLLQSLLAQEAQTLISIAWSEPYRMSDFCCARERARSSSFMPPSHYFLSDLIGNVIPQSLLVYEALIYFWMRP